MNDTVFPKVPKVGDLYLLCTLFEYENIDIVFICNDKYNNLYLCLCTDAMFEYTCLVKKISIEDIITLLFNSISVYDALKNNNNPVIIVNYHCKQFTYTESLFSQIAEEELPDKNEYLDLDEKKKEFFIKKILSFVEGMHSNVEIIKEYSPYTSINMANKSNRKKMINNINNYKYLVGSIQDLPATNNVLV